MTGAAARLRLHVSPWRRRVWGGLVAGLLLAAGWPYFYLFEYIAGPVVLGAAVVGYLPRRRWGDALWLALPAAAASFIEPGTATRVLVCLALPCFAWTLRPRFAVAVAASVMAVLLAGVHLKLEFAGTRLTWQDLRFFLLEFGDNVTVLGSQPTLLLYAGLVLLVLAGFLYAAWASDAGAAVVAPQARWLTAVLALVLAAWNGHVLEVGATRLRQLGQWNTGLVAQIPSFPFARFLESVAIRTAWTEPLRATERFASDARERLRTGGAAGRPADIVVFLQESQLNPAMLEGCPSDLCSLPAFGADPRTRAYGPLRVHVFGGGTWLTEFAVATGVPHTSFGEGGDFAPFTVAPGIRRSFVRSLRDAGYHTVAIYPVRGGMMNARKAYQAYGYDRFLDSDDLGLSDGFQVSDQAMHAAALRVLEQERRQGKPVLLFVVTIFNHSEHGVKLERVPAGWVAQVKQRFAAGHDAEKLADYLWRTREFGRAFEQTREAVLGGSQPAVLAWFGDHQPPFTGALAARGAGQGPAAAAPARMLTWYQVSSNRPPTDAPPARPSALDVAFLPGVLAEAAGVPLDDLLAANVTAREQCGGLLRECARPEVRDSYLSHVWRDLKAFELP